MFSCVKLGFFLFSCFESIALSAFFLSCFLALDEKVSLVVYGRYSFPLDPNSSIPHLLWCLMPLPVKQKMIFICFSFFVRLVVGVVEYLLLSFSGRLLVRRLESSEFSGQYGTLKSVRREWRVVEEIESSYASRPPASCGQSGAQKVG